MSDFPAVTLRSIAEVQPPDRVLADDATKVSIAGYRTAWFLRITQANDEPQAPYVLVRRTDGSRKLFSTDDASLWDATDGALEVHLMASPWEHEGPGREGVTWS